MAARRAALDERLDARYSASAPPPAFVLIAADGSQIFPDRHSFATYYLLNTGAIVLRAGSGQAPSTSSEPEIFYEDADVYDEDGQVHTTDYIGALRNRREISVLADLAEQERATMGGDLSVPIICLIDGPLLPWMRPDPERTDAINEEIGVFCPADGAAA